MKQFSYKKHIMCLLLLLVCSLSYVGHCEGQWIWQNIAPQGNRISSFSLLNESSIIAFGYPNTIIKSTNGGNFWTNLSNFSNYGYDYKYSYFLNENTGWIQTNETYPSVKTFKTMDGGKSWSITGISSDFSVGLLDFINESIGYSFHSGRVIKTTNGGFNWSTTNFPGNIIQWTALDFIDINTGWAAGYITYPYPSANYIMKTIDGGLNWINYDPGVYSSGIKDIKFVNSLTGWYSGDSGIVRKTTNGGINWLNQSLGMNKISGILCFTDDQRGWVMAFSPDSVIFRTTNGGTNWIPTYIPIHGFHTGLKFVDQNTGYIFGGKYSKQIIKTTNSGQNWFFLSSGIFKEIRAVHFSDTNYGWAVGGGEDYLRTTNGGDNWILADIPGEYFLKDVYFKDQQTGWILTTNRILKTINSGLNWIKLYDTVFTGSLLGDRFCIKNENEILVPAGNSILKSSNGGLNWYNQNINNGNYLISEIKFFSQTEGWLISRLDFNSKLFKTTDGGQTWTESLNPDAKIDDVYFLNASTGWLVALKDNLYSFRNLIYRTTNGGVSWISYLRQDSGVTAQSRIFFENESTGICIGGNYLHRTTNGGVNWNSCFMLGEMFSSMYFLSSNIGWLCGTEGTILKTTTGSSVWVRDLSTITAKENKLEQNYPNPFNPVTKIKFSIIKSGNVKLDIYDITGRKVETLVNEILNPGTYMVTFNGSALSSGVYFYKLTAGDFSSAGKMHLVK